MSRRLPLATIASLSVLAALVCAASARANVVEKPATDAQSREARQLIETHNGAGARNCLGERQLYEAYHRVDPGVAWNPDNPVDWYVGRNTVGLFEALVNGGYGAAATTWNEEFNGTDYEKIGLPCRSAGTPRALASCLNDNVAGYFKAHPRIKPTFGGSCKLYAATLVRVSEYFPPVTRQASIVASAHHAFNRITIRDAQSHDHDYLIDALNNMVVELTGRDGKCPAEGTLGASAGSANAERAREAEAQKRQQAAAERIRRMQAAP